MTREEALNKIRQMSLPKETMEILEVLAPELKESEDERIRRKMLEHFRSKTKETWCNIPVKDIIAYLEKQKDLTTENIYKHSRERMSFYNGQQKEQRPISFYGHYNPDDYEVVREGNATSLKQKEQKPAEWSEEDEDMLNSCISSIEEAKENRYAYKENDGDTSYDREINWLKSLRPQPKKGYSDEDEDRISDVLWCIEQSRKVAKNENDMGTCWSAERFVKSLRPQQRQEWSEEEKEILDSILSHYVLIDKPIDANGIPKEKYISLIKSIRFDTYKNCNSQKQEWDTHDKAIVNCIVCCLDGQFVSEAARKQSLEWFNKHRRDFLNSTSWKPSEEQMSYLWSIYKGGEEQEPLRELIQDLKKL